MSTTTAPSRFSFTSAQKKVLFALASMVGLRMLGLFLVLPVFTLYGLQFTPSKFLVGSAFGAYALVMAILQIPLGRLSDRIGRRRVLVMGMTLFSAGSFLCAIPSFFPHPAQIWVLIVGRLVQGGGAIVSVAFATVADYVGPEQRSTAMAILGIPIGVSAVAGVIAGPLLAGWFGTAFLFWMTGFLALATDFFIVRYLRDERPPRQAPAPLSQVFVHPPILVYSAGGFLMNFCMTAFFFNFPLIVTIQHHLKMTQYYTVLLPIILVSAVTMFAFTRGADMGLARPLTALAYLLFIPSFLLLFAPQMLGFSTESMLPVYIAGTLFYIGFTGLEPVLPSLVSKSSPTSAYGTALGIFGTIQFLGSFLSGPITGLLANHPHQLLTIIVIGAAVGFIIMAVTSAPSPRAHAGDSEFLIPDSE
jgi:MFS family permease